MVPWAFGDFESQMVQVFGGDFWSDICWAYATWIVEPLVTIQMFLIPFGVAIVLIYFFWRRMLVHVGWRALGFAREGLHRRR